MTDFRAELQLLFDDAESFAEASLGHHYLWVAALNRAHAALAEQPVREGPTDEALVQLAFREKLGRLDSNGNIITRYYYPMDIGENVIAFARAVLARWGNYPVKPDSSPANQPEPVAPTDEELIRPIMWMLDDSIYDTAQPVPVSERLPGPEDCDSEGGCWWWHPDHKEDDFDDGWILLNPKWAGGRRDSDDSLIYTHWLPHWALPVPAPTNTINQED